MVYNLLLKKLNDNHSINPSAHVNQQINHIDRLLGYSVYKPDTRYRCIFLRDITEKVRLESIAGAVNAMDNIGYIFSGIRHEIGNPLNSLKMTLSVLTENLNNFSQDNIQKYVDRGLADICRMEYLLKSLKTFSLYDHIEFFDIPLKEFMDKFLSLIKGDFNARGIPILVESRLDIARIRIDKQALHQVLLNIFNNAADALKDQTDPQIKIRAKVRARLLCMTISDNGCGISLDRQKRLFQPFNTSKPKGNGLGLVITRKLLAMMNSDIKITSEQHLGTRVTISLPISPEQKESAKFRQEEK